ncbi:ABC transporter permease [bacterium]|nr:ABC transporter permease [bacterium]
MKALFRELVVTFRFLFRSGGSTLVAILILTLGLAVTIFMFSAINAYILKPLPFPESERLVHLEHSTPEDDSVEVNMHDFLDWRATQKSFDSLAGFYQGTINLSGQTRAERFDGAFFTHNVLSELRVKPYLGRLFLPGEDQPGAPAVVILGFDLWRNRYQGDQKIIGKTIRVNAKEAVVVGIMPPGFQFPVREDVWVPLTLDLKDLKRGQGPSMEIFGRLRTGVTLSEARAEFRTISSRLAKEYPATNKELMAVLKPYAHEYVGDETRTVIYTMFAAVLLVLLIACANVANLTVVRMIGRSREFAIRTALGAGRWRLVLQVFTECLVISMVAGVIAVFLADYGTRITFETLRANPDMAPPFWINEEIDWRIISFSVLIAFVSAILAGLLPALRASRTDLNTQLHQGGWGMAQPLGRTSRSLVIAQIAFSCVLLILAGLMTRSVLHLDHVKVGANVSNLLTGRIGLFESKYPDADSQVRFYDALVVKLSALPNTKGATLSTSLPGTFTGFDFFSTDKMKGDESRKPIAWQIVIAPNYFQVLEIPVFKGRSFDSRDHKDGQKVAIVNQMLVDKFWQGENPIGRRLRLGQNQDQGEWLTVVGVTPNVLQNELEEELMPAVYLPIAQTEARFISLIVRTQGDPMHLSDSLRKTVEELDPDLPVYWLRPLEEWIRLNRFDSTFMATLFGIFAIVAIALAAAGQYSVLAYTVGQRTKEIGVRRALGALDQTILKLFLNQGLRQFLIALLIGLPIAMGFARLLANQFVGVSSFDPTTLVVVPMALLLVTVVAAIFPARRALRVDPAVALRAE